MCIEGVPFLVGATQWQGGQQPCKQPAEAMHCVQRLDAVMQTQPGNKNSQMQQLSDMAIVTLTSATVSYTCLLVRIKSRCNLLSPG